MDPSGHIVNINSINVNSIDYLLRNPELLMMVAGSEVLGETIGSEEYQTYNDFRDRFDEQADMMEKSDTIFYVVDNIDEPEIGLPVWKSGNKYIDFSSESGDYHFEWQDRDVYYHSIDNSNKLNLDVSMTRVIDVVTGIGLFIGGSALITINVIVASPAGPIGYVISIPLFYEELGFMTEGINRIYGRDIFPDLLPIFGQ